MHYCVKKCTYVNRVSPRDQIWFVKVDICPDADADFQ